MAGTVTFNGATSFTGSNSLSAATSFNIDVKENASIGIVDGDLTLSANQQTVATNIGSRFIGISVFRNGTLGQPSIETTGMGDITLNGRGGTDVFGNYGVNLVGATIRSTASGPNAGAITLNGAGGLGPSGDHGVFLQNRFATVSQVTSVDGDITFIGEGNPLTFGQGVYVANGSVVSSTGTGSDAAEITMRSGTAGVNIEAQVVVTSIDGDMLFDGTGGSMGARFAQSQVSSTGTGASAAKITIHGTASGMPTGIGVDIASSQLTSATGNILITGQGGGNGTAHVLPGVLLNNASVSSTGTGVDAATITIDGTGGLTQLAGYGVDIRTNTMITSVDGDVLIKGQGGMSGTANTGVNASSANDQHR
jgi:hypothetical protein